MKVKNLFLLIVLLFSACSPQALATPVKTTAPSPTPVPSSTSTLVPTQTATITPNPTETLGPSLLTFDIGEGVPPEEIEDIQTGLERIRVYLRDYMGGDISPDIRKKIIVTIVANGENRTSAFDENGIRLWFDVKGIEWARDIIPAPFRSLRGEHIKTVHHEYVHGWQNSFGCVAYDYNLIGWWMSEGMAEYIAYQTVFQYTVIEKDTVRKFMLGSAEDTGESAVPLQSLEDTRSSVWPGHIGYLAIEHLMTSTKSDPVSLRTLCEQVGTGTSVEDAFMNVFDISRQDFYTDFAKYLDTLQ